MNYPETRSRRGGRALNLARMQAGNPPGTGKIPEKTPVEPASAICDTLRR